ncbi:hypothetical protein D3C79_827840 [compost metagenome]
MVATGAHAAERCTAGGTGQLLVPVDDASAAAQPEVLVTGAGVGQQAGSQAVLGVVGLIDGGIEVGIADHLQQRAEELFVRALGHSGDIDNARGQQCGIGLWLGHLQQLHGALGDQFGLGCNQRPRCLQRNH